MAQPNNQAIKQGEHLLGLLKKNQTYPIALLHYMNSQSVANEGKLRAAIELKLWAQSYKVTPYRVRKWRNMSRASTHR